METVFASLKEEGEKRGPGHLPVGGNWRRLTEESILHSKSGGKDRGGSRKTAGTPIPDGLTRGKGEGGDKCYTTSERRSRERGSKLTTSLPGRGAIACLYGHKPGE